MKPSEFVQFDGMGLAALVHSGETSPAELAEAAIERIDAPKGRINAVTEKSFELAGEAAGRVDPRLPLAGVPFMAKDMNIDVAGSHLTASCRWLAGMPAATDDAPLARSWRAAGLAILGRTNLSEWAEDGAGDALAKSQRGADATLPLKAAVTHAAKWHSRRPRRCIDGAHGLPSTVR
jgi:amidase